MMLKINKTLPKNKARISRCNDHNKLRLRYLGLATLICGIMPGLVGLGYYVIPSQKVSAVEQTKTIDNIKYMQELSKEVCDATAKGVSTTLIDLRDDSEYGVAKLSDGKCWMTQNLKLDLTQAGIATVAGSDALLTNFPETALESLSVFTNDNTAVQFSKSPTVSTEYPGNGQGYKDTYGYYYSWCAATGGTCSAATTDGANASGSICPKGWKLPQGGTGTTNDFAIMGGITTSVSKDTNHWSDAKNISFTNGVSTVNGSTWLAAGDVDVDGLRGPGASGNYWSSTASSSTSAYYLYFNSSRFSPAHYVYRYVGFSVRCISADIPEAELPKENIPDYPPIVKDRGSAEVVAVVVPPVISIDTAEGDSIEVDPNVISSGTITAKVSANTNYVVQLSANQTSLLDSTNPNNNSIPASSNVVKGTNAWGIKNENNAYSAITSTPTTYYNTTTTNEDLSKTHTFDIGVSVASNLPVGEYSTTVTITAVNN